MTEQQELAATQLLRAFRKCHSAGLSAAIFDGSVCVWPKEKQSEVMDSGHELFNKVREHGRLFVVRGMWLDGGAGV
jgi:hypothetical protein